LLFSGNKVRHREMKQEKPTMTAAAKLLTFVLSMVAGSTDVIGFLGLGNLFMAHITGNLVILAARLLVGGPAPVAHLLSVPVFIAVLMLTRLFVSGLERARIASLQPLLLLQSLLLCCFVATWVATSPSAGPEAVPRVVAGMLGVSAMAVQNALMGISLTGAPSTAVMTTNVTVLTMDLGEILLGRDSASVAKALCRAKHTWPAIAGFLLGCGLGAPCEVAFGLGAMILPTGFSLAALSLGAAVSSRPAKGQSSLQKETANVAGIAFVPSAAIRPEQGPPEITANLESYSCPTQPGESSPAAATRR
jgi:uncharacterized membrane protein YoaK (UPF0700 family)